MVNVKAAERMMNYFLLIGIVTSILMITCGGMAYLLQHSHEMIANQNFYSAPQQYTSFSRIVSEASKLAPRNVIQLGLLMLFLLQIARVALTAGIFLKEKNWIFLGMSVFIFCVLILPLM